MENGDIIVIDNVRELLDNQLEVVGRVITDKAGNEIKIKKGQGGKLQDRWDWLDNDGIGQAIKLKVELYKGKYPYVADFEVVKDEFVKQAAEKVQKQIKGEHIDSIETQVSQKGGIEVLKVLIEQALLTNQEMERCRDYAMASIDWAMGRLTLPVEIVSVIEKSTQPAEGRGKPEIKTAGQLFQWIRTKDPTINAPRDWVNLKFGVKPKEILTEERVKELYEAIKIGMGW